MLFYYILYIYIFTKFSNRSQMTSKCGMNKKVTPEEIAECAGHMATIDFTQWQGHLYVLNPFRGKFVFFFSENHSS